MGGGVDDSRLPYSSRAAAGRLLSEARSEAEESTQTARREVEDLARQRDAITSQLGQLREMLGGIMPGAALAGNGVADAKSGDGTTDKIGASTK